jgi:hypothetical protein
MSLRLHEGFLSKELQRFGSWVASKVLPLKRCPANILLAPRHTP